VAPSSALLANSWPGLVCLEGAGFCGGAGCCGGIGCSGGVGCSGGGCSGCCGGVGVTEALPAATPPAVPCGCLESREGL
jgi:hypothetical protein